MVVTPANNSVTSDTTPTYSGTAEPNSTVTIIVDGIPITTVTADAAGNWTYTPTSPLITEGAHTVSATATDAAGNTSAHSATNTFILDTTAPAAPVVVTPANGTATNDNTPTITGTAEANSTVTVYLNGSAVGTTTADSAGNWTFTPATALTDGTYAAKATATDAVGNVSVDSNTNTFTVDTTAPVAPVVVTPANGSVINDNTPTITGTAEANSTVTVYLNGTVSGTTTADAAGNWTFTPTTALADGTYAAKATSTDAAGNVSVDSNTNTFTLDATAPSAPVVLTPANGSVTNDTTPTYSGTAEPNSTVTIIVDGTPVTTVTADAAGNWTYTPTTPLSPEGSHTVSATATDAAGNTSSPSATNTFTLDTTAPDTIIDTGPAQPVDNSTTVTFTFHATETGSTFECRLNVGAGTGTYAPCTSPKSYTGLTDGPYTFEVRATDPAGNVDPTPAKYTWTVDTSTPDTIIDSGPKQPTDNKKDATFTFHASQTGSTFECRLNTGAGTGTFSSCTSPKSYTGLADGTYTFEVRATNSAGTVDPTPAKYTWTVDTSTPDTIIDTGPKQPVGNVKDAAFTFHATKTGSTFECRLNTGSTPGTYAACTSPKSYPGLADGTYTFEVRATDPAGNTDASPATYTFTVDTTAPAAPVVTSPATGSTVDTLTPVLSGTAEPGSTVTVLVDGTPVCTATTDASGNWSCTPTAPLAVGPHDVTASATDPAGNTGPGSAAGHTFTVAQDTTAPDTTIVSGPSGTSSERNATFELAPTSRG